MKKVNYFFALLFLIAAFVSCDKRDVELKGEASVQATENGAIPIENIGNTSCEDVALEKNMTFVFSSGKADYVNGEFVFESPYSGWPEGLTVIVTEGKYVKFTYTSDKFCVGAVIVKGGNASNVYTYNPGVQHDELLSAPINSSLKPAELSNLTFCFVECEKPKFVIALKTYMTPDDMNWAVTGGGESNSWFIGYYDFVPNSSYKIFLNGGYEAVGDLLIKDFDGDNLQEVQINNYDRPDLYFTQPFLYIGPVEDFNTNYTLYPIQIGRITPSSVVTIDTPY